MERVRVESERCEREVRERVRVMGELTGQGKQRRGVCAFLHGPSTESMINLVKVRDGHDDSLSSLLGCMESDFEY